LFLSKFNIFFIIISFKSKSPLQTKEPSKTPRRKKTKNKKEREREMPTTTSNSLQPYSSSSHHHHHPSKTSVSLLLLLVLLSVCICAKAYIFIYAGCSQEKYTPSSPFESNLNSFLASVVSSSSQAPFNNFALGNSTPGSSSRVEFPLRLHPLWPLPM